MNDDKNVVKRTQNISLNVKCLDVPDGRLPGQIAGKVPAGCLPVRARGQGPQGWQGRWSPEPALCRIGLDDWPEGDTERARKGSFAAGWPRALLVCEGRERRVEGYHQGP